MSEYIIRLSLTLFGYLSFYLVSLFPDLSLDLKKAKYKRLPYEHISLSLFFGFLSFVFSLPFSSLLLSFFSRSALVGYMLSLSTSSSIFFAISFVYLNYPKSVAKTIAKEVDNILPFLTLNLSLLASAKLPLDRIISLQGRFAFPKNARKEIDPLISDISIMGIDKALEKAIERASSENFRELLYGLYSLMKTGGDISSYLKEKSRTFLFDYRRKLSEFSRKLGMFTQIYLIAIIVSSIFFTVLLTVFGAIGGIGDLAILMQFFLIAFVIPLISIVFIILLKAITPSAIY